MAAHVNIGRLSTNLLQLSKFRKPQHVIQHSKKKFLGHFERFRVTHTRGIRTKRSLIQEEEALVHNNGEGSQPFRSFTKPVLFTAATCGCSFVGAMIWQYEDMRSHAMRMKLLFSDPASGIKHSHQAKHMGFRQHINSFWNNLTSGQKFCVSIIAANTAVFLVWKIRNGGIQHILYRYFSNSPTTDHSITSMLGSVFSHKNGLHLLANMYVFWSFSQAALHAIGKEQLAAVYISGGVISSLVSCAGKRFTGVRTPSLGASGAVLALLGVVCSAQPDARLTIAFIGEFFDFSFSAQSGLIGLILFDSLGFLLRWRVIDHAGHLGGVLFGIWYWKYGRELIWNKRESVMKMWHSIRSNSK